MIPNEDTLLRDRSATSSTSTASRCCASTSSGATTRSSRRSTCRRPSARSSTRWAARRCRRCRREEQRLRPRGRRPDHPRGRRHAHGQRSDDVGAEQRTARRTTCKNLFVADGGPFVSQADKNCTWTILALAMRTERVHRRRAQEGDDLMSRLNRRDRRSDCSAPRRSRPRFTWTDAEARAGARARRRRARSAGREAGDAVQAEVLHRARVRDGARAGRHRSSRRTSDRAAPPTPACRSSWTS